MSMPLALTAIWLREDGAEIVSIPLGIDLEEAFTPQALSCMMDC